MKDEEGGKAQLMKDVPSWRTKEVVKAVRNAKLSELYDVAMPASCRRVTTAWSSVAERVISDIGVAFCDTRPSRYIGFWYRENSRYT